MSEQRRMGIGIIGVGYWGPKIVRSLTDMDDVEIVKVADLSEERLRGLNERHPGLPTTTNHCDLLVDPAVDAVIIATPIRTHHRLGLEALLHGKHVLVEKPLAASSAECEEMIDAARTVDRTLMVGHTFQYNPAVNCLRDLIRAGELGRILHVDAARLNLGLFQRDINVMWDLAPHDISILIHILSQQPETVSARGEAHLLPEVDDLGQIELGFPDNVKAHVKVSWLDPGKVRRVTVIGSRKMAVFDDTAEEKLRIYDKRVALRAQDAAGSPFFEYYDGDVEVPTLEQVEPLKVQLAHFLECIRTGRTPVSSAEIGLQVVRILEAADDSRRADGRRLWLQPGALRHLALLPPVPLRQVGGARAT